MYHRLSYWGQVPLCQLGRVGTHLIEIKKKGSVSMEELEREEISREDIITYVDMLLEKHRFSYNRRLAPLLYEFFLRSAKTFNWSKDEFLDKYINFNNIVKKIKFKKLAEGTLGLHSYKDKSIYISEDFITELKKNNEDVYNQLIDTFYHECLHATDFEFRYGKEGKDGLKEIENGYEKNLKGDTNIDMMLNEYGNIISSALISSNTGLYEKNVSIWPKLSSYQSLWIPGTVFCTAFDISEKTIAELKDKGRVEFDKYFKEKYPYLKTDVIIEGFRDNLSIIHNAVTKKDKENIILGHLNIIELGNEIINQRILHEFTNERNEEFVQRMYFNLHKIYVLINNTATEYKIDKSHFANVKEQWNNLYRLWNFYKVRGRGLIASPFFIFFYTLECILHTPDRSCRPSDRQSSQTCISGKNDALLA